MTREEAGDLLEEAYGDWSYDDPDWWEEMLGYLMPLTVDEGKEWLLP